MDPDRTITRTQARRFYDRLGAWLDTQRFYEDPALNSLIEHAGFQESQSVFEFGCGTGRFAARLLKDVLAPSARYTGIDISPTMVRLAAERLRPWGGRVDVRLSDGAPSSDEPDASYDRFVATYVIDLLAGPDIIDLLADAHRILVDDGLLCTVTLTYVDRPLARLVTRAWTWVHRRNPLLVGGCRPVRIGDHLAATTWQVDYRDTITRLGLSSEITLARKVRGHQQPPGPALVLMPGV